MVPSRAWPGRRSHLWPTSAERASIERERAVAKTVALEAEMASLRAELERLRQPH